MFGLFKPKQNQNTQVIVESPAGNTPVVAHMSDAKQQLFAQLKAKREELGPEEIQRMQKAVEMQALQQKIKHDIENDEDKLHRLLDEIRFNMQQD